MAKKGLAVSCFAALKLRRRRILSRPVTILCVLVIFIGGLHTARRKHEGATGLRVPGIHGIHMSIGGVGLGHADKGMLASAEELQRYGGPRALGIPTLAKPSFNQEPWNRHKCSNSNEFPFKQEFSPHHLNISTDVIVNAVERLGNNSLSKPRAGFPWPKRENFMPNYFLNYKRAHKTNPSPADHVLIFLHHNKAAGTTTKECLRQVVEFTDRELGHVLSNNGRLSLMANVRKLRRRGRRTPDTYFGGYAFGACDELQKPCSYFTVLRDPYRRTLSSHSYCKTARTDQLCSALNAKKVTLREWALHQGSFFFRQLIFHPEFCNDDTKWIPFIDLEGEPHEFDSPRSLSDATCWFRQKLIMSLTLNRTEYDALLQYCLDNLEKWFKVIMLVDEFDLSLAMMEHAYKLPFHSQCSGRHANIGSYAHGMHGNDTEKANMAHSNSSLFDKSVTDHLRELQADSDVQLALRADMMIYQKGVEIFEKQRNVFTNINYRKKK